MPLTPQRAAFFDVDNTLVRGSTIYFLGRGMYQRGFFTKSDISRFVLANLRFRLTGTEKQDEINRFQKSAQDFIGGHNVSEIKAVAQEIYDEYVSPALWEGTIEIAQRHLNDGVEVWLVTAAPEDMATLIAERLGFTGALGSKAAIEDGHYTGAMNGPLLHGREKATAIQQLAKEKGFDLAKRKIDEGNKVIIITARMPTQSKEVEIVADMLGIKRSDIYYTSHKNKWEFIKKLNVSVHYDNNADQIEQINRLTKSHGVLI